MRDDSHKWAPPFDAGARLQSHDVTIATHRFERLTLVSGTAVLTAAELPIVGWPDIAPGGSYAVSLRRDRILEVNGPARADGWDGTMALAISDMTDGYHAFTISGSAAMVFLSRGAPLSIDHSSRSTARLIFGLPGIVRSVWVGCSRRRLTKPLGSGGRQQDTRSITHAPSSAYQPKRLEEAWHALEILLCVDETF